MFTAMLILLIVGVVLYVAAAGFSMQYLWRETGGYLTWARTLSVAAIVFVGVVVALRWAQWGRVPLTNPVDILNLFLILCTVTVLIVQARKGMAALICFYLPPLAFAAVLNALLANQYIDSPPKELRAFFLIVHVGLAYLAYALYFIASLTAIAYIVQSRNLKARRITGMFQRLPSLEQLDRTLYWLIAVGYPFFVITLILGLYWSWVDRELLGPQWWLSNKVLVAWFMVIFYTVCFFVRRRGLLRGPKLSYLVAGGFGGLMSIYIVAQIFDLGARSFWQSGASM